MAVPGIPSNVILQVGNGDVLVSWDQSAGATSYGVYRSSDNVSYSLLASPTAYSYLDTTAAVGTQYWYTVLASNGSGSSAQSNPQSIVPVNTSDMSLGQLRLYSQQRADRVNSQFVTMAEWNSYINQSYKELYDLLVDVYEDYFVKAPFTVTIDNTTGQATLPSDFYKLIGVDLALGGTNQNGYVTLKKFDFIARNRYVYPNIQSTYLGIFNLRYRLVGNTLMFIPNPSSNQSVRIWYIPKLLDLLQDTDIAFGVSGWTEYIIVDAAIKALQKEESDVSVLMMQKQALIKRIEEASMNRDAGQPDTISDIKTQAERWGGYGGFDGPTGGY